MADPLGTPNAIFGEQGEEVLLGHINRNGLGNSYQLLTMLRWWFHWWDLSKKTLCISSISSGKLEKASPENSNENDKLFRKHDAQKRWKIEVV